MTPRSINIAPVCISISLAVMFTAVMLFFFTRACVDFQNFILRYWVYDVAVQDLHLAFTVFFLLVRGTISPPLRMPRFFCGEGEREGYV